MNAFARFTRFYYTLMESICQSFAGKYYTFSSLKTIYYVSVPTRVGTEGRTPFPSSLTVGRKIAPRYRR